MPCWNAEADRLYKEFCESGEREVADELIQSLDNARREKWLKTVQDMNFTHSSRKAWSVIRHLGAANAKFNKKSSISANEVATRLVQLTKVNMDKRWMTKIRNKLKCERKKLSQNQEFSNPFNIDEIIEAISVIKPGKAAGLDCMYPEFIRNCGEKTIEWLTNFFKYSKYKECTIIFQENENNCNFETWKEIRFSRKFSAIIFAERDVQIARASDLQAY